jgi:hypothetical protein
MTLNDFDPPAIDADVVVPRVGFRAQLANRHAVHRDTPIAHQLLGRATRGDPRLGQDFLKPLHPQSLATKPRNREEKGKAPLEYGRGSGRGGHVSLPPLAGRPPMLTHRRVGPSQPFRLSARAERPNIRALSSVRCGRSTSHIALGCAIPWHTICLTTGSACEGRPQQTRNLVLEGETCA